MHGVQVVQKREALRIANSYRTISGPMVLVAKVVLIDLPAFEQPERTYNWTCREATHHREGTRKHPPNVAITVGRKGERTVDAQTDSVDIQMGKT